VNLIVLRESRSGTNDLGSCIPGRLTVDGRPECFTAELRGVEIPAGTYPVTLSESNHLKRLLPLLGNVPGRTGIRIHSINNVSELEGCVGVGLIRTSDNQGFEYPARLAETALVAKIQAALDRGEACSISVQESA
jgi:hypothetical protein